MRRLHLALRLLPVLAALLLGLRATAEPASDS